MSEKVGRPRLFDTRACYPSPHTDHTARADFNWRGRVLAWPTGDARELYQGGRHTIHLSRAGCEQSRVADAKLL